VPVVIHHDNGEEPRRECVLALRNLRRGVERHPTSGFALSTPSMTVSNMELTRALVELIAALDRRVPQVERVGEASIARDADDLRQKARKRLAELEADAVPAR
jgi:hypothetical protein